VTARQSLLSTYLFYQTLAWMGRSAGSWLASLGSADAATRARVGALGLALGGIEVQIERDGRWLPAGEFRETGPLASDTRAVPLPAVPPGALHVRLELARGMWRLDQAALVTLGDAVTPRRVPPVRVLRRGRDDTDALARLTGAARPLVTQPGDTLTLVYDLPAGGERAEIFLESRGYYLEWVRDAWIAEENPVRLARMFLDPRNALREMAPEFKRAEPGIEAAFWGSRYAR